MTMRKFSYDEIVTLNPLQTRYQLMSSRVLIPLYAAANDGIYRMNRAKIAGSVFGIIKLVKIGKRFGRTANELEGELVVSWSQVKTIVVMNVRQENVANGPSLLLNTIAPTYKEIGDWHVLTTDGRDITIPNVDDPHNKLNYVKNRFNLNFS